MNGVKRGELAAVIVVYHPDESQLSRLITTLLSQEVVVVVCDNGGGEWVAERFPEVHRIPMAGNCGVGAALNVGFRWALDRGFAWVVSFDQDSLPEPQCLPRLLAVLRAAPPEVAAVAPMIRDTRSGALGPLVGSIDRWWRRPKYYLQEGEVVALDHAITSGMVVRMSAWRLIGPFREDFFIDYIDVEWCVRARLAGYQFWGVGGALLDHDLGERWIFLPGGTRVIVHRPERAYFEMRNGLLTHRLARGDWRWQLWHVWIGVRKVLFYLLFLPDRRARLRAIMSGIQDALRWGGVS